jgi:hypothetical protein
VLFNIVKAVIKFVARFSTRVVSGTFGLINLGLYLGCT